MKRRVTIPTKASFALLMLVVVVNALWPVFFTAGRFVIRQSQAESISGGLEADEYITKTFTAAQVEKAGIANAKELTLDGELYDVVSVKKTGSSYEFTLLCDEEETLLDNTFKHYTKHHHKQHRHKTVTSLFLFYFLNDRFANGNQSPALQSNLFADYTSKNTHPGYQSITAPPPKYRC